MPVAGAFVATAHAPTRTIVERNHCANRHAHWPPTARPGHPVTSPAMADRHLIDVHVMLIDDDRVLLTQRRDRNPLFDGLWHLPSGKLDASESVLHAAAREADEEVGVLVDPTDLRHVHTIHVNGSGPEPRLGLFFATNHWIGEPVNREPTKCAGIAWFTLSDLPDRIIDYPAAGIHAFRNGHVFSIRGWSANTVPAGTTV
jgi:8-oxo-dGTP diphosphatase